jgi:hypothetical protein
MLEDFISAYIECALWSSTDNTDEQGGAPLEDNYDESDFSDEALKSIREDCTAFYNEHIDKFYKGEEIDIERAGHDFWLSRCGHGSGFFDGDYNGNERLLQDAARIYGNVDIYIGDDGKLYVS